MKKIIGLAIVLFLLTGCYTFKMEKCSCKCIIRDYHKIDYVNENNELAKETRLMMLCEKYCECDR